MLFGSSPQCVLVYIFFLGNLRVSKALVNPNLLMGEAKVTNWLELT